MELPRDPQSDQRLVTLVTLLRLYDKFGSVFSLWCCNHCVSYTIQDPVNHSNSTSGSSTATFPTTTSMSAASVLPSLQFMLQLNTMERVSSARLISPSSIICCWYIHTHLIRKQFLNWSSLWNKPQVMSIYTWSLWYSFTLLPKLNILLCAGNASESTEAGITDLSQVDLLTFIMWLIIHES